MDQRRALQIASIENARKQLQLDREKREQQLKRRREREQAKRDKKLKITETVETVPESHKKTTMIEKPITEVVPEQPKTDTEPPILEDPIAPKEQEREKEVEKPIPTKEITHPPQPPLTFKPFLFEARLPKKPHSPLPMRPSPYLESSDSEEDEDPRISNEKNNSPKPSDGRGLALRPVPTQKNPFLRTNNEPEVPTPISPTSSQTPSNIPSPVPSPQKGNNWSFPSTQAVKDKSLEVAWNAGRYLTYMAFAVGIAALRSVMQRRLQQNVENALEYNLNAAQGQRIPVQQGEDIPPPPMDTGHTIRVVPIGY